MTDDTIPEDVQAFLLDHVRSFEELETLLLLRSQPAETWTEDSVGEKLRISSSIAAHALEQLALDGIISRRTAGADALYQYDGAAALAPVVERFVRSHQEQRIEIMKLMTRNAVERLRGSAIKTFADAFLVGRKKDG